MIDAPLALAFSAGLVAAINPCGFAMLPAYLSYFIGIEDRSRNAWERMLRALAVGLAVSGGFMVVFAIIGALITKFAVTIQDKLPYVTMAMGIGVTVLGVMMLRGYEPTLRLPKLERGTAGRELPSMFLFGVSYAVTSLSCTIGLFLVTVANTFTRTDFASGFAVFLCYAAGMALVLMVLTIALAFAKEGITRRLRSLMPHIHTISGVLLILAGAYLAYFGWYEARVLGLIDGGDPGGPGRAFLSWNAGLQSWVNDTGALRVGIVLLGVIAVTVLLTISYRGTRDRRASRADEREPAARD